MINLVLGAILGVVLLVVACVLFSRKRGRVRLTLGNVTSNHTIEVTFKRKGGR